MHTPRFRPAGRLMQRLLIEMEKTQIVERE
jgi:hypothetical protein